MTETSFTYDDLQNATNGRWIGIPENRFAFSGIKTNTRDDCSGALFIALEGERFNAHDFLDKAIESGAAALCIAEKYHEWANPKWNIPLLIVEDTLLAYQQIARFHKRQFKNLQTVAVTGSIGKTSVKEIIRSILTAAAGADAVCATEGNTNNQVGVPQNLLRLNNKHRFCVLEMGTNHHGEIEPLSLTGEPDVAVISSIAPCHLEFLEDLRGVAKEKSQIFSGLKTGGTAIIPLECPEVDYLREKAEKFNCL
ncbi:MAG: UDP-N-acetylmuramoyl-tripeptide--D-alanyl-D-alanine ligase, partial [Victivallaceae bacterium]